MAKPSFLARLWHLLFTPSANPERTPVLPSSPAPLASLSTSQGQTQPRLSEFTVDHARNWVARQEVEDALSVQRDFLLTLGHELRSAANGVEAVVDLLRRESARAPAEALEILSGSSQKIHELIDGLLHFSELTRGCGELAATEVACADLVQDVLREFRGIARRKRVDLAWEVAADVPSRIRVDPYQVATVLRVLLEDALRATVHGAVHVVVSVHRQDGAPAGLRIKIEDCREPGEVASEIGDEVPASATGAFRLEAPVLGFALARQVARALGGDIAVREASTGGRVYRFWFLAAIVDSSPRIGGEMREGNEAAAMVAGERDGVQPVPMVAALRRVLVVDDDAVNRRVLGLRLARFGLNAELAADGNGACERAGQTQFDAIFLDCDMPGMDGYTAAAEIRAAQIGKTRTPIFAVTGWISAADRRRCHQAGMDEVVPKPVDEDVLGDLLWRWNLLAEEVHGENSSPLPGHGEVAPRVLVLGASLVGPRLAVKLLEREGCHTVGRKDVEQALGLLGQSEFDVVLIDDELGEKATLDFVQRVRLLPGVGPSIPLILLAGHLSEQARTECFGAGVDVILGKPLTPAVVRRVLRQWVGVRQGLSTNSDMRHLGAA